MKHLFDRTNFFESLSRIKAEESAPSEPDSLTRGAMLTLELEEKKAELKRKGDRAQKSSSLADVITWIVILYLLVVLVIVIWQGMLPVDFRLDKAIVIALLTTTTANVIGLLYLLIKYVFDEWLQK